MIMNEILGSSQVLKYLLTSYITNTPSNCSSKSKYTVIPEKHRFTIRRDSELPKIKIFKIFNLKLQRVCVVVPLVVGVVPLAGVQLWEASCNETT